MAISRTGLILGSAFAGLGVAFGAFGAHALRSTLGRDLIEVFDTGIRYQMYHAFALLAVGIISPLFQISPGRIRVTVILFAIGIILFSGSLYALALTGATWFGYFTPLGGLAFMAGWGTLLISVRRLPASPAS